MDRDERTNVFLLVSVSEVDEVLDECLLSGLKEKKKSQIIQTTVKPRQVMSLVQSQ